MGSDIVMYQPFKLRIVISSNKFQYKCKVLNFLEVTGIIGGLFELFEVVFGIIIGIVSSYSLRGQLIEEIKINKKKNQILEKELDQLKQERHKPKRKRVESQDENKNYEEDKVQDQRLFHLYQIFVF